MLQHATAFAAFVALLNPRHISSFCLLGTPMLAIMGYVVRSLCINALPAAGTMARFARQVSDDWGLQPQQCFEVRQVLYV